MSGCGWDNATKQRRRPILPSCAVLRARPQQTQEVCRRFVAWNDLTCRTRSFARSFTASASMLPPPPDLSPPPHHGARLGEPFTLAAHSCMCNSRSWSLPAGAAPQPSSFTISCLVCTSESIEDQCKRSLRSLLLNSPADRFGL